MAANLHSCGCLLTPIQQTPNFLEEDRAHRLISEALELGPTYIASWTSKSKPHARASLAAQFCHLKLACSCLNWHAMKIDTQSMSASAGHDLTTRGDKCGQWLGARQCSPTPAGLAAAAEQSHSPQAAPSRWTNARPLSHCGCCVGMPS